jgi:chemotaxis signal transduction protein
VTQRPVYVLEEVPDRALIFESHGGLFGIPLSLVSQVVPATPAFCPLPLTKGPIAGLFPHAQVLWPVYSAGGLLGAQAGKEELFLLTELAGQNVGLTASRVLGVHGRFTSTSTRGEYQPAGVAKPALFLDLQRMFS